MCRIEKNAIMISPYPIFEAINHIFANLMELEGISTKDVFTKTYFMS
jgi:hypothetical protein